MVYTLIIRRSRFPWVRWRFFTQREIHYLGNLYGRICILAILSKSKIIHVRGLLDHGLLETIDGIIRPWSKHFWIIRNHGLFRSLSRETVMNC